MEETRQQLDAISLQNAVASLTAEEEVLLKSCLEAINDVIGDSIPDSIIISQILRFRFNTEKALDSLLKGSIPETEVEGKFLRL